MFELMLVVVLGTSIWMAYDSAQLKVPVDNKPYSNNNGAPAWFLSGLLLWIATFPYYLVKRSKHTTQKPAAPVTPVASQRSMGEELAELTALHKAGKINDGDFERAKARLFQ